MSEEEVRRLKRIETLARRFLVLWYADGSGANAATCDAASKLADLYEIDIARIWNLCEARDWRER
jgi:hypothetical protein